MTADLADRIDPATVDFYTWRSHGDCSTAACIVGHACTDPAHMAEGLRLAPWGSSPTYAGAFGWHAVAKFYGLTERQARRLCHAESYEKPSAEAVATRIRLFVAEYLQLAPA